MKRSRDKHRFVDDRRNRPYIKDRYSLLISEHFSKTTHQINTKESFVDELIFVLKHEKYVYIKPDIDSYSVGDGYFHSCLVRRTFLNEMWMAILKCYWNEAHYELCKFLYEINVLELKFFLIIEYIYSYLEGNTDMPWFKLCAKRKQFEKDINTDLKRNVAHITLEGYRLSEEEVKDRYNEVLGFLRYYASHSTQEEITALLDYYLYVIISDIVTSCRFFYLCHEGGPVFNYLNIFPYRFAVNGEERCIYIKETCSVDLSKTPVIVNPWNKERTIKNVLNLKDKEFVEDTHNHKAYFYKGLMIAVSNNGHHSINAGTYWKKGSITADILDVTKAFTYVDTDGVVWLNKLTGEEIDKVADYRIAILYELQRMRFNMKMNNE